MSEAAAKKMDYHANHLVSNVKGSKGGENSFILVFTFLVMPVYLMKLPVQL